jgi:cytochrome c biogenesis protein CcmG/thiol:disulfide interchange protein DsbE
MVVGVDVQDTEPAARQFIVQFGLTFPNGPDPKGQIAIDYGVYGVPETFIIDRQGTIAFKQVGAVTDRMVAERVGPLLKP